MEIKIDEKMVQETINEQSSAAVKAAFEGYGMRSSIEKAISDSVIPSLMAQAIEKAASEIDMATLTKKLSEEMARSVTRGVQAVVRETMINVILDIKKIPSYDDKKRSEEREKLLATVF